MLNLILLYSILTGVLKEKATWPVNSNSMIQVLISVVPGQSRQMTWLRGKCRLKVYLVSVAHHPKLSWEYYVESWMSYPYKTFSNPQVLLFFSKKNQLLTSLSVFNLQECQHVLGTKQGKESGGGEALKTPQRTITIYKVCRESKPSFLLQRRSNGQ